MERLLLNDNMEGYGRKGLHNYTVIYPERLNKTTENLNQDSWSLMETRTEYFPHVIERRHICAK